MPSFQHILFPVDFSDQNRGIAPHVVWMAQRYKARVTMLNVLEIPGWAYPVRIPGHVNNRSGLM
jgi:nucleotide-binding universal stress UspA family protein